MARIFRILGAIIASVFLFFYLSEEAKASVNTLTDTDRLLFEQIGPADSSIAPFFIEVGELSETTRDNIYVTSETYQKILAIVSHPDNTLSHNPQQLLMFKATLFRKIGQSEFSHLYPKTMHALIKTLQDMYQYKHLSTPQFIILLETDFANQTNKP